MAFWRDHWDAWAASGVSQRAYCARHGLSLAAFGYWRNRIREAPATPAPTFVPVVIDPPALPAPAPVPSPSCGTGVEIRLGGGRVIAVGPDFDEAALVRVIRALEQMPC
jgi:hypothetical protein